MNDSANTNVSSHIVIRDKTTGQVIVNKRLIQPTKEIKEAKNEPPKNNG